MRDRPKQLRCAIYTRKSSEENLEQDFNSLHAQREACEAYVTSQRHEGWQALPARYDDGGFSGGTMDRPGLARLLADLASGLIDIVVVYKVDRLTRSLTDFARIVEAFDARNVSFVSVTQAFNTTSSMGRLTLNVLLSFAQFEREVTGERIRDKIAASKKKGLWMGGYVPLGYEKNGRTLVVNEAEAGTVRTIFRRYLELKSVDRLKEEVDRAGLRSKLRSLGECSVGASLFSRGHLYRILENPLYAGRIAHKEQTYPGLHPAIVDLKVWDAVQRTLAENSHARLVKAHTKNPSLLTGLLYDEHGRRLVATHANKKGRRYRYYVSASARNRSDKPDEVSSAEIGRAAARWRLPAAEIEAAVVRILGSVLSDAGWLLDQAASASETVAHRDATLKRAEDLLADLHRSDPKARRAVILRTVSRIVLHQAEIELQISPGAIAWKGQRQPGNKAGDLLGDPHGRGSQCRDNSAGGPHGQDPSLIVTRPLKLERRGAETRLVVEGHEPPEPERDPALIKAVAQAHRWWGDLVAGRFATVRQLAAAYGTGERYAAWVIRLAFLSSDLTRAILAGTQPPSMTLHQLLTAVEFPMGWRDQGSL